MDMMNTQAIRELLEWLKKVQEKQSELETRVAALESIVATLGDTVVAPDGTIRLFPRAPAE